ncbi:hypothetical protein M2437_005124 [Methylorubrum pseudosasae]|nr:hypothetical protein [Methylorubrum pseudosasae]
MVVGRKKRGAVDAGRAGQGGDADRRLCLQERRGLAVESVVVDHEVAHADRPVEGEPLEQLGRRPLDDGNDGECAHLGRPFLQLCFAAGAAALRARPKSGSAVS